MPATARKPIDVVRRAIHLQDALNELTTLARQFPQLNPLQRQATRSLEEMVRSIDSPAVRATHRTQLVEPLAQSTRRPNLVEACDQYSDRVQREIELWISNVREFRDLAVERMELTLQLGDDSNAMTLIDTFSKIRRAVEQILILCPESGVENDKATADEFRALADGLEGVFRDPLQPGAADQVQAAVDDLLAMLERVSGVDEPTVDNELTESLFERWTTSPPSEDTIRRFFNRYHL